jgi:hypothetical protein
MGLNGVAVSPSPENGNRFSFRNVVFAGFLEYGTMDKVRKPSNSKWIFFCVLFVFNGKLTFIATKQFSAKCNSKYKDVKLFLWEKETVLLEVSSQHYLRGLK